MQRWITGCGLAVCMTVVVAAGGCGRAPDSVRHGRWNLLLVTLDTFRADHMGCYGYHRETTPGLDRLAAQSLVFEQAMASSAVTPVSHASILTGLEPYRHGLRSLHGGVGYALPEDRLTLAEILSSAGYETAAFVSAFTVTRHYALDQGFATFDQEFDRSEGAGLVTELGIVNTGSAQRRGDQTTDAAVAWLARPRQDPFFVWVHYFDVHDPIVLPPDEYAARFQPEGSGRAAMLRAIYDMEASFIDDQVQRLLRALGSAGVRDSAVIVVVGDHGEGLGDHDWWGHTILYQEQVRVPLLLVIPGTVDGRRIETLVRTVDLVPTLVDLLGIEPPSDAAFDGHSLLPLIEGAGADPFLAYAETVNDLSAYSETPYERESLYAVNDGRWKLLGHWQDGGFVRFELYDLVADPSERHDLADAQTDHVTRLRSYLEQLGAIVEDPPRPSADDATAARLRALGYLR